ncbi:aldo/keto reductase [Microbacterium sp. PMB16]|uniref:aldo/keto reductase n=1 Tax=Microbacterium sp. PMB16 TaxID=3120157 RepID=UPI003F4C666B
MIPDDIPLSPIGLGAAQFGNMHRVTSDLESETAVIAAWNAGIRYFDTAPHYGLGLSEARLGRALREYPRDEFAVSTKAGRLLEPSPETADQLDPEGFIVPAALRRRWDFSRDGILRSVDSSLERLGLDRLDIVYLHDPDQHWDAASTTGIGALVELREQGVVGAIGVGMNQSAMLAEFVRRTDVDIVMVAGRFTLIDRSAVEDLLPLAWERGVDVVAAGIYNSGLLSSALVADDAHFDYVPAPGELIRRARLIAALAEKHGIELPDAAVQFPLRHPAVASVVIGTRTAAHVQSSIARASADIPEAFWSDLADSGLV